MAVAAAAAASSLEAVSAGLLNGTSLASSSAATTADASVATPPASVRTTSPLPSSAINSSPSSQSISMMMSPLATPSPSLADAVTFPSSSSSSPVPGQLGVPPLEQEKVLGVTILTQLQELDLAIKHREQNKVDGRKTRWIEHRKKQEELGSSPGSASGTPTGSSSTRKRRSGSAGAKHKKENIDVSSCLISSSRSLNSSPYKTDESSVHDSTPPDNNNITPYKLPISPDTSAMKIEVSEPLVGSVGPSNVLETMKQQFLQDTIKDTLVDSAKLIINAPDSDQIQEGASCNAKKKKPKAASATSLLVKKKKGRPKRLQRGVFPQGKGESKTMKAMKNKNGKAKAVNGSVAQKKANASSAINNFFIKAKTRGLRDVRKPEENSDDSPNAEDRSNETEVKVESEPTGISGGTSLLVSSITQPSKCLLIAATAKVLSNKGPSVSKKSSSKSTKLTLDAKKKKSLLASVNELTNGNESASNSSVKIVKIIKKKLPSKQNKSGPTETLEPLTKESQKQTPPDPLECDSSEPTDVTKRGRARVFKRKHETNSCSPSPKCSKKTSTVVAEVHNSMNGEPQQTLIVCPKPGVGGRKRRPLSPVKNTSSVANVASNNSSLMTNGAQSVATVIDPDSDSNHERTPLEQPTSATSPKNTTPMLSEQPSLESSLTTVNRVKTEFASNGSIAHSISTPPLSPLEGSVQNRTSPNTRSTMVMTNGSPKLVVSPPTHSITNGDSADVEATKVVVNLTSNDVNNTLVLPSRKKSSSPVKLIRTGLAKVGEVSPQSLVSDGSSTDKTSEKTSPRSGGKSVPSSIKSSPSVKSSQSAGKLSPSSKKLLPSVSISTPSDVNLQSVSGSTPIHLQNGCMEDQSTSCFVTDGLSLLDSSANSSLYLPIETKEIQSAISSEITDQEIRIKSPTDSDCDNNNRNEPEVIDLAEKEKSQKKPDGDCVPMNKEMNKNSDSVDAKKPRRPPRFLKALFKDEGVQNMLKSIEVENSITDGNFSSPPDAGVAHKLRPKRPPEHSMAISPEPDLEIFFSTGTGKRKRKCNEADSLYMDEGALNLLTSCSSGPRRGSLCHDDLASSMTVVEDGRSQQQLDWGTRVSLNGTDQLSDFSVSAIAKRKPGRPQKPKSYSSKSSSPSSTPDLEIEIDVPNIRKKGETTLRRVDDNIVQQSQPSKTNALGTDGRTDHKMASGGAAAGPSKGSVLSSSDCTVIDSICVASSVSSMGVNRATAAVNKQGHQSPPVKMRRADLPTSPTMSSLDSLVRSLEGSSGVVPTSGVAFVPHRMPESLVPPLRGMRGLMTVDGSVSGGLRQSQRTSVRQTGDFSNISYRDIVIRKMNNFAHIIMAPVTTKIKNSLNSRVLRELCDVLSAIRGDSSVRLVLITSNGSSFCQGVDLTCLHHSNPDTVNEHAHNLARAIKEFLRLLVQFPKPIIAGVNGNAMGLGVTMLPLFDMVYASDNAEFYLPYSKLGQVPEGGATYTFPTLFGKLQATRLFMGHKFSAHEGVTFGLVSEVLWPANFNEALLPKVALLATQSAQV
ncbi:Crotonase superfamily [Trinorchestia longiramus]|nr:Crotonase superfamily [Trinorchestia longiramus]